MKKYLTFVLIVQLVLLLLFFAVVHETREMNEAMIVHTRKANNNFKLHQNKINRLEKWSIDLYNQIEDLNKPIGTRRYEKIYNIPKEIKEENNK